MLHGDLWPGIWCSTVFYSRSLVVWLYPTQSKRNDNGDPALHSAVICRDFRSALLNSSVPPTSIVATVCPCWSELNGCYVYRTCGRIGLARVKGRRQHILVLFYSVFARINMQEAQVQFPALAYQVGTWTWTLLSLLSRLQRP